MLDKLEISRLLNRHRSKLVSLWNRDDLQARSATLNEEPKPWAPSERRQLEAKNVILPGERCDSCNVRSKKRLARKSNLT